MNKCNGEKFTLTDTSVEKILEYADLFQEPYVPKRRSESRSAQDDCLFIS